MSAVPGDPGAHPAPAVPDVASALAGLEDLPLDLQVRTLAGVEADLRAALEATRS